MTNFSQLDISDEPRGFTVDEVLEVSTPEVVEGAQRVEDLIREQHAAAVFLIDDLVHRRSVINASIKQARADQAILESAVARYDRLHTEAPLPPEE